MYARYLSSRDEEWVNRVEVIKGFVAMQGMPQQKYASIKGEGAFILGYCL